MKSAINQDFNSTMLNTDFSQRVGGECAGKVYRSLRSPHLSTHKPFSREGCLIFVKTGHLPLAEMSWPDLDNRQRNVY